MKHKPKVEKKNTLMPILVFAMAFAVAWGGLYLTATYRIDLENLAKGEQNTSRKEEFQGKTFTAFTVQDIKKIVDTHLVSTRGKNDLSAYRILWLGNSQLHYINQYKPGDHLSPYWLRMGWKPPPTLELLGCSLPNANIQEFLILSRYIFINIPVHLLLIELVFDDFREDGLRNEFGEILYSQKQEAIASSSPVADILVQNSFAKGGQGAGQEDKDAPAGTIQIPVEKWLNGLLSHVWGLWASRPQMEGKVYLGVYNLRNFIFGIKPTTVRKMIPARYNFNMEALQDILVDCQKRKISVLLYVAPIRQDTPIPYDYVEYNRWKKEVADMAQQNDAHFTNLEQLVPGPIWGNYIGDNVDFMHFQGPGHRLVAEALLPHIETIIEKKGR